MSATISATSGELRHERRTVAQTVLAAAVLVGYLGSAVAANWASVHLPSIVLGAVPGGVLVPAGTVFAGVCLTGRDLVQDLLGARGVVTGIAGGAVVSAVLASPQIAVASVAAFTASEVVDTLVYTRLHRRSHLGAVAASNAVGLVVDSVVFVPLAFGSLAALPGQILGKTVATLVAVAALHVLRVNRRTRP